MAQPGYSLEVLVRPPDFEAERRFVLTEMELAHREMEKLPDNWWRLFSYPGLGVFRRQDWHEYIHKLEKYRHELEHHEREIREGLVPLQFDVVHDGERPDREVRVHVGIVGGSIYAHKKAPKRPVRIDGSGGKRRKLPRLDGFARTGIHIGHHGLEAEFSGLGAQDSALVVNQKLYVKLKPGASIEYSVRSRNVPDGIHGEIKQGELDGLLPHTA